jgi:hypothetical protein
MNKVILLLVIEVLMQINLLFAQQEQDSLVISELDTLKIAKITLTDNSVLIGKILEQSDSLVIFKSTAGLVVELKPELIKETEYLKGEIQNGKYVRYDPSGSRLFFSSTARTPKAGSGYFSVYELLFPFFSISATDFLMISGGMSIVPGASGQIIFIAPKIRFFNSENFCAAGGILYINIPDDVDDVILGYGVVTLGTQRAGFTVGYGSNISGNSDEDLAGILILGGDVQLSNSVKLISENYIPIGIEDGSLLYSFGIRFFGDNLSADLGFFGVTEETEGWPFAPWVGFTYNF